MQQEVEHCQDRTTSVETNLLETFGTQMEKQSEMIMEQFAQYRAELAHVRKVEDDLNEFKANRAVAHENLDTRMTDMARHFDTLLEEANERHSDLDSRLTTSNDTTLEKVI